MPATTELKAHGPMLLANLENRTLRFPLSDVDVDVGDATSPVGGARLYCKC